MKRVYCLYRVSTKGQVDHDDIPMQRTACRAFAERNGWTICKEFLEKGVSGYKTSAEDRDAIQDLKIAAEKKEFDILLVFMFDRLGRIPNETPFVLEWFVKTGVQVWSAKEGQQTFETDVDYLMNYIRFWQAGGESRKTSMRVQTRMRQMVEAGQFTGGVCPFGYRFVKSGECNKKWKELVALEVVPEEAAIVQFIFHKTVAEGYGTWRLSDAVNALGYKTHRGAKFQSNTINRILHNRIFTGRFVRGGKSSQVIEALKIVEDNEFEEAQKIVAARQGERQERMNIAYTTRGASLLSGNIFCAHCGAKLYAITYSDPVTLADGTKKKYKGIKYICSKRIHKRGPCDGQTQYASKKIDGVVLEAVHAVLQKMQGSVKDESLKKSYEKTLKSKKAIYAELLREQAKEQEKLNRLLAEVGNVLMNESSFSLETLNRAIELTKTKLAEFEEKIPKALKELNEQKSIIEHLDTYYDQFKGWAESFDAATNEEKKMIICKLISRIEVGRGYKVNIVLNMDYGQFVGE